MVIGLLEIFGIALALAADAFCTALGVGTAKWFPRQAFRLSFHFGLFQALMPVLGWWLGRQVVEWVQAWDHWLAGGILLAIGAHMLWESFHPDETVAVKDRSRKWSLVALSIATSIDALAVGVVFGVMEVPILFPCLVIGVVAALMTLLGLHLGRRLRRRYGAWLQIAGAVLLILLALKFFTI